MGAPEFVLRADFIKYKEEIEKYSDYRGLVLAKSGSSEISTTPINLEVLGFLLIQDKIRKEAPDTLKYLKLKLLVVIIL